MKAVDGIEKIVLYDINLEKGQQIAKKLADQHGVEVEAFDDLDQTIEQSDIITVATSGAVKPKINTDSIKPGTLIILTGSADLEEDFYRNSRLVSDLWAMHEKWLEDGLNHPAGLDSIDWAMTYQLLKMINSGDFDSSSVDDLGDIIAGNKEGRKSEDEVIVMLTGGLPTEDAAWGYRIYQNALEKV